MMNSTKLYYVSGILGLIILSSIIHKGFSCLRVLMEFLRSCRHVTEMTETVLRHDLLFVWVLFPFGKDSKDLLHWRLSSVGQGCERLCFWSVDLACAPCVQCAQSFPSFSEEMLSQGFSDRSCCKKMCWISCECTEWHSKTQSQAKDFSVYS